MPSDWNPAANLQRRSLLQWCGAGLAGAGLAVAATQSRAAASAHTDTTANAPPLEEFPHLEFVYTASVGIAALEDVGDTVSGHQRLIPITGGTFEGPRLRGKVLPGGAEISPVESQSGLARADHGEFGRCGTSLNLLVSYPCAASLPNIYW